MKNNLLNNTILLFLSVSFLKRITYIIANPSTISLYDNTFYIFTLFHLVALTYFVLKLKRTFKLDWFVKIYLIFFLIDLEYLLSDSILFEPNYIYQIILGIPIIFWLFKPNIFKRIIFHIIFFKAAFLIYFLLREISNLFAVLDGSLMLGYFSTIIFNVLTLVLYIIFAKYLSSKINSNPVVKFGDLILLMISFPLLLIINYFIVKDFYTDFFVMTFILFCYFLYALNVLSKRFKTIPEKENFNMLKLNTAGKYMIYQIFGSVILFLISIVVYLIIMNSKDLDSIQNLSTASSVINLLCSIAIMIFIGIYTFNLLHANKIENKSDLLKNPKKLISISSKLKHIFFSVIMLNSVLLLLLINLINFDIDEYNRFIHWNIGDLNDFTIFYIIALIPIIFIYIKFYQLGKIFSTIN